MERDRYSPTVAPFADAAGNVIGRSRISTCAASHTGYLGSGADDSELVPKAHEVGE